MLYSDTYAGQAGELLGKVFSGSNIADEAVLDVERQKQLNYSARALNRAQRGDFELIKRVLKGEDGVGTTIPGNQPKPVLDNSSDDYTTTPEGSSAKPIIYSDWSPAASYFGMDQSTAYAEHMANTAHQREVADLKAAGLNPVLGISGAGASGVSGSVSSGASSAQKGFSFDGLVDVIGATASLVTMALTKGKNPSLAFAVGNAVQAGGNLLFADK